MRESATNIETGLEVVLAEIDDAIRNAMRNNPELNRKVEAKVRDILATVGADPDVGQDVDGRSGANEHANLIRATRHPQKARSFGFSVAGEETLGKLCVRMDSLEDGFLYSEVSLMLERILEIAERAERDNVSCVGRTLRELALRAAGRDRDIGHSGPAPR